MEKTKDFIDASLILALSTATLYFLNYIYVTTYFESFGVNVADLDLTVNQVLAATNMSVVLMIMAVMTIVGLRTDDPNFLKISKYGWATIVLFVYVTVAAICHYGGQWDAAKVKNKTNNYVLVNGRKPEGGDYQFLGLYRDRLYLFHDAGNEVQTLALKLETIDSYQVGGR